ncbi:uncharacterized protein LOC110182490 [Drosophila serrata]|uniref:uncharacterized protein LOC110182490 n=1 Tax=Drosophila serrata TaxID=7274 RepID=UPI000A1D0EA4|nr:uncharacterized protein LOC110182490 [Drosophila serrata]
MNGFKNSRILVQDEEPIVVPGAADIQPVLTPNAEVEPAEGEAPAVPAATPGIAPDPQPQSPNSDSDNTGNLVIDENNGNQVNPDADDASPQNEMNVFSNGLKWTTGMVYDWDFEEEDKQSISSDETTSEDDAKDEVVSISDSENES